MLEMKLQLKVGDNVYFYFSSLLLLLLQCVAYDTMLSMTHILYVYDTIIYFVLVFLCILIFTILIGHLYIHVGFLFFVTPIGFFCGYSFPLLLDGCFFFHCLSQFLRHSTVDTLYRNETQKLNTIDQVKLIMAISVVFSLILYNLEFG